MAWPWLAQVAKAWGSERQRVPCRQEPLGAPGAMMLEVPAVTVGVAAPVVATPAGVEVPVAAVALAAMAAVETALAATAAAVRLYHINK
jgi:hypothetical protein